jgi:CRISPR-associated endonuclease Csn1
MKKILGLDLGTNSIGWALVGEAENKNEKNQIIRLGVRIINYDNFVSTKTGKESKEPEKDFMGGKGISPNAGRTLKRSMRRNLQRYKLRREQLIETLKRHSLIQDNTVLAETGNRSTFKTYEYRSKAASEKIPLDEFCKVLLMINKKRGYKSSRNAKRQDDGQLIDGMAVAKKLYDEHLTPGQYVLQILKSGKMIIPDFYISDLKEEFKRIWEKQASYYPETLNPSNFERVICLNKNNTSDFFKKLGIERFEPKGNFFEKKKVRYQLRNDALERQLDLSEIAEILTEINNECNKTSGYLGAISNRSKELYFNKMTVGQYLWNQIQQNPHTRLKGQVFYRQDYLDEFERIWEKQAEYYPQLSNTLKEEIRDVIIFYQRKLKSQKGLISFCEFEQKKVLVEINGKQKEKTIGMRVIPRSSPLFQQFKIWQILNNVTISRKKPKETYTLNQEEKEFLFEELNTVKSLKPDEVLKLLGLGKDWELNYKQLEGNATFAALYQAIENVVEASGHDISKIKKFRGEERKHALKGILSTLGINPEILEFNPILEGNAFEKQASFQLWHLLYSYEGDDSATGNESLYTKLKDKFGIDREYAPFFINIELLDGYGSLSAKAIRKILPHLMDGLGYDEACGYAGFNHSNSLNKQQIEERVLKERLDILPKNSLRNPVVEKILNQMINVVNAIIDEYGKPDEIRLELARELKKNAKEREAMTQAINKSKEEHENISAILRSEFGLTQVSRNDIIRFKLYKELEHRGYKTLYSNTYIPREKLFSKEFDIEHIIPQSRLFDDSFSNKTLELHKVNNEKADKTALDYVKDKYGEKGKEDYTTNVLELYRNNKISKTKRDKLLMQSTDIPENFIARDLRDTQYIAKRAKELLLETFRYVNTTTGSITERLREDWQLVNIMQELNWDKYKALGLTEEIRNRDGHLVRRIKDWTKRNDHRHHAMDALTVAFTKPSHVQYLNNLNARSDKSGSIYGIEQKELYRDQNGKLLFKPPMPINVLRMEAKKHLEMILVSIKAKNKVVTRNINKSKYKGGFHKKMELTPRGQLHLETIYGSKQRYQTAWVKVGANMDEDTINKVANQKFRKALMDRLIANNNDAKKAFTGKNSLDKNPLYTDNERTQMVPEKVKLVFTESYYTIRKDVGPDLNVEKITDPKVRQIIEDRITQFNGDKKAALSNLDEHPIWQNKEKGIQIRRVTITGVANADALRVKRDHHGNPIINTDGRYIPADFVNTGNNHHVAIYRDAEGNLQEKVVSFLEAVMRVNKGLSPVDKELNSDIGWNFLFTMKQNEYFVFPNEKAGFNPSEIDLINENNYSLISPNLFRVQKIATKNYFFRHHLETQLIDSPLTRAITWENIRSTSKLSTIVKIRVNHVGKIIYVGEY